MNIHEQAHKLNVLVHAFEDAVSRRSYHYHTHLTEHGMSCSINECDGASARCWKRESAASMDAQWAIIESQGFTAFDVRDGRHAAERTVADEQARRRAETEGKEAE